MIYAELRKVQEKLSKNYEANDYILRLARSYIVSEWNDYRIGSLLFYLPNDWEIFFSQENSLAAASNLNFTDEKYLSIVVQVEELSTGFEDVKQGQWQIVHYGMEVGDNIEVGGTLSKTFYIGHMKYILNRR